MRFTPNNSGQRLPPTYYRGCWHVVSRGFLVPYRQSPPLLIEGRFVRNNRALRSEELPHSRGVAPSGLRPLRKILDCSLPQESGQCLSPSVGDHPLRPPTRRSLGGPLPRRQANGPRAHPQGMNIWTTPHARGVLIRFQTPFPALVPALGAGCSRVTHPSATGPRRAPFDLHA